MMLLLGFTLASGCLRQSTDLIKNETDANNPALNALAERADTAIVSAGDSIGREFANRLRTEPYPAWLAYFKGKGRKPNYPTQENAIKDIENFIQKIDASKNWPKPGEYTIPKMVKSPVIDGKLDDEAWKQAAVWTEIYPFNKTEPDGPKTIWRMLWDDQYLYFAFNCDDTDVSAPERKRDDAVYFDDSVEMFILPDFRFRTYWEIVIAPNGSVFDSIECKNIDKWGCSLDPLQNVEGMKHAESIRGTLNKSDDIDQGYTVEIAVPFSQLPGYERSIPKAGDKLHFMLVRLDRTNGKFKAYSFRPIQGWGHNIWNHAVMELK